MLFQFILAVKYLYINRLDKLFNYYVRRSEFFFVSPSLFINIKRIVMYLKTSQIY